MNWPNYYPAAMTLLRRVTPWRLRIGLFALACAVMLSFVSFAPSSLRPKADYNDFTSFYQPVAENLVAGRGLTNADHSPALHNPPGYVFTIAGVYEIADALGASRDGALTAFAVIVMALCAVVVFEIGYRLFGRRAGVVAALLWMTYPVNLIIAVYQFSEVPFTLLLGLLVIVGLHIMTEDRPTLWWAFALGAVGAVAALVRPAAIAVAVPLALALWLLRRDRSRRWRALAVAALLAGNVALVLPWEGWVYVRYHQVVALSTAGEGSTLDGLTVGYRPQDETGRAAMPADVRLLMARAAFQRGIMHTGGDIASFLRDEAVHHPLAVTELVILKAGRSLYGTNRLELEGVIAAIQAGYLVVMFIGGRRAWRRGGNPRRVLVVVLLLASYFWLVTMTVLSIVRYMSPVLGLLFPFAALMFVSGNRPSPLRADGTQPSSSDDDGRPAPASVTV
jgi:4-amino-4-deoxy-L-arabinose transferase-like glycosyltransferase